MRMLKNDIFWITHQKWNFEQANMNSYAQYDNELANQVQESDESRSAKCTDQISTENGTGNDEGVMWCKSINFRYIN